MGDPAEGRGHRQPLLTASSLVSSGDETQRDGRVCAHRLVALIGLRRGAQVLDVATGTGWAALAAGPPARRPGRVLRVWCHALSAHENPVHRPSPDLWGVATPEPCRTLLQEAGFSDMAVRTEPLGYDLSDAHAYWDDTVRWNGGR